MLIRHAKIDGHPGLVDLRLMHGAVREIGVSLTKGLYESELDVQGDELRPWQGESLPRSLMRRIPANRAERIVTGTPGLLMRYHPDGSLVGPVHQHSAD